MMKELPITFFLDYSSYPEVVRKMYLHEFADNGGKYLVLNETMIQQIMQDFSFAQILRKEAEAEGLAFLDSHAPFAPNIDLIMPHEREFELTILRQKMHLHIACMFNVKTMTMHIGNDAAYPELPLETHLDNICRKLDKLLPEAEKCDVIICMENIWFRNNTPENLLKIKARFPSDYLGFCYDAAHANIMNNGRLHTTGRAWDAWNAVGVKTPQWDDKILEKMLPHIVNCHLHDNNGAQDEHKLPGDGCVDWSHVMPLLRQAPRLQLLQSEVVTARHGISTGKLLERFNKLYSNEL
ncbi:MAG: sugar phosphate isomerase/epimerase [Lentisphaerae bacterium]|nr:sugar phosphate isomerase/epimerase [Lentisphaerota bacterium]